jgi:hypothetical protein
MKLRPVHLVIPALGLAAAIALGSEQSPLRGVLVASFLILGPGVALLWLTGITDRLTRIALVVPLSLTIDLLVATVLLYMGLWSPALVVTVLVVFTIAAIAMAPFEWPARMALITVALLPGLVILVGELTSTVTVV